MNDVSTGSEGGNTGLPHQTEMRCAGRSEKSWTCFHCDETFTSRECAAAHFGGSEMAEAACKIKGGVEYHLVRHIRDLEAQLTSYRTETDAITSAWQAKNAEFTQAILRAEELGYSRGLRDGKNLQGQV